MSFDNGSSSYFPRNILYCFAAVYYFTFEARTHKLICWGTDLWMNRLPRSLNSQLSSSESLRALCALLSGYTLLIKYAKMSFSLSVCLSSWRRTDVCCIGAAESTADLTTVLSLRLLCHFFQILLIICLNSGLKDSETDSAKYKLYSCEDLV